MAWSIVISKKDYEAVRFQVEDLGNKDLARLLTKMQDSLKRTELKITHKELAFSDEHARKIAVEVIGQDNIFFGPIEQFVITRVKINKYFKSYSITEEIFRRACKVALEQWRKPIMYEILAFKSFYLGNQPQFNKTPRDPQNSVLPKYTSVFGKINKEEDDE